MKTLASRLSNLEDRVWALPRPADRGVDTLAAIIKLHPHLASTIEHMLLHMGDGEPDVPSWYRCEATIERAQLLIDAIGALEDDARRQGRYRPSECLAGVARAARLFIKERAA